MRIIRTIIFCASMVVYSSTAVRASVNNNQIGGLSNNPDATLIEKNQNRFEFGPQTLSLELPDAGSVSVKNFPKLASVHFLTESNSLQFNVPAFEDTSVQNCKDLGYTKTSCSSGNPSVFCPYNNAYFKECCDASYKYTADNCTYPNTLSKTSCGGKYQCTCDTTLYPVTSCTSPQTPATGNGSSCTANGVTRYSECVCPSNYTETCTGQNQQGRGSGCTYKGTTKYTACECKPGYNQTCTELGPVTPNDYCLMNGIRYYNNCKTCENKCKLDSCPAGVSCTLEDCSGKYCDVGCATGYVNWCTKPETDCAKLGYTKSVSQCSDGYLQCPYNSAAVFCEDVISVGSILYGDGTVANGLVTGKTPIGIVFDTTNHLAVALTDVKKDGTAGSSSMYWASSYCDTPNLDNCTSSDGLTSCGVDGRTNTNAILASTCIGTTYAANGANAYEPSGCSKDFCKKTKWFLPSMRDLITLYNAKSYVNASLSLTASSGAKTLMESYYWSSTEYDNFYAWRLVMSDGTRYASGKTASSLCVRPVVKY